MRTIDDLIERSRRGINCVVAPVPVVTIDKLRVSTHRAVWIALEGPLGPREYLLQNCQTKGCVLPRHHEVSPTPYRRLERCRNGHPYGAGAIQSNGNRVCDVCLDVRRRRRKRGGLRQWEIEKQKRFCPQGHEYTKENIYWETTPAGHNKRHCKTCTIARAQGKDPASVAA
jgi:hypothetical protein